MNRETSAALCPSLRPSIQFRYHNNRIKTYNSINLNKQCNNIRTCVNISYHTNTHGLRVTVVDRRETHSDITHITHIMYIHLQFLRLWHVHTYLVISAAVCPSPSIIFNCSSSVMGVNSVCLSIYASVSACLFLSVCLLFYPSISVYLYFFVYHCVVHSQSLNSVITFLFQKTSQSSFIG